MPRVPVLHLAPWVDLGGSDKGTIDWFRWLDRDRFAPSLMTTQPSPNRRLRECDPYAVESWSLPDLVDGPAMPEVVLDVIATRGIEVLHVMNSRLGFELLPDLASLPRPPKVVVQLHVEEQDRSGYVRLVCTRYGNLVDAFSVTSDHLAAAVEGYDVPRAKIHVIRTGVDAEEEFSPATATPVAGLEPGLTHVLYPGRLVEQKDPLLMVEVLAQAVARRDDLRLHVVGDGALEDEVRRAVRARGLGRHVSLHPATTELAGWYAACDALLMTSVFEGVPYVAYEAMAMGLPVVAPALPGNVELLRAGGGVLVDPRDDAAAYAEALAGLAADPDRRRAMGATGRERALGELSVREMGAAHGRLYDALLADREPAPAPAAPAAPEPVRFERSRRDAPTVSIVTPCFNHGRYLPECLAAIRAQTWQDLEVIVVDDASTDPDTLRVLDELEAEGDVRVVRLAENGGPSRARNAALDLVTGRYVLPVDADNLLLPGAVEQLVEQLRAAPDRVGFVYPSFHYFGNRRYRFDAPAYNAYDQLLYNVCDTASLFDAQVFAQGVRFAEDIRLGHEDWDLMLQLAARGIEGEPSRLPVMYYRKTGFTRSDLVDHASAEFSTEVRTRHPELYGPRGDEPGKWGWHAGPAADLKARWAPGLSIVALEPVEPSSEEGRALRELLARQSHVDAEVLVRSAGTWSQEGRAPLVRRIPADLAPDAAAAMQDGLDAARAPYVLVTAGNAVSLLDSPAFCEQLLRSLLQAPPQQVLVLGDGGPEGGPLLRRLTPEQTRDRVPHSLLLRRDQHALPDVGVLHVDTGAPVASLMATLNALHGMQVEWRHVPVLRDPPASASDASRTRPLRLTLPTTGDERTRAGRVARLRHDPALPALPAGQVRRWTHKELWAPALTKLLLRYRDPISGRYTHTVDPQPGLALDRVLGAIHQFQPPGTAELLAGGPAGFAVVGDADEGAPLPREPQSPATLGFLEEAAFPLLVPLLHGYHRLSDQHVLLDGDDDPLRAHVEVLGVLGWMEDYPNRPRLAPASGRHEHGFRPLVRSVDLGARRHRYAVGHEPAGEVTLELGALHNEPQDDAVPVWIEGDRLVAPAAPQAAAPDAGQQARWALAPLRWRGGRGMRIPPQPRLRAVARRTVDAARAQRAAAPAAPAAATPTRPPDGYLWAGPGPGRRAVHVAVHPVTGDQLVTPWPLEAADLGYGPAVLVGHAGLGLSLTGSFDPRPADLPWASHFGRRVRQHDLPTTP